MRYQVYYVLALCLSQCHTNEEKIGNQPPVSKIQYEDLIDQIHLKGDLSTDPEHDHLDFLWSSPSHKVSIKDSVSQDAYFDIPNSAEGSKVDITLKANDGTYTNQLTQSIDIPPLTQVRAFGLGRNLQKELSVSASRDWYLDQGITGPYSDINCGPTSVTMAIRWADKNFMGIPENARSAYRSTGGWWYTNDVTNYLNDNKTKNWTIALDNIQNIKTQIDNGNIAILCVDMYFITSGTKDKYRFGKFYAADHKGWGHFIVIKGYKIVDDQTFFEVYDPFSLGKTYQDQTLKGKNRYYKSTDLDTATQNWWDYAIIISSSKSTGARIGAVDDKQIVHMSGR